MNTPRVTIITPTKNRLSLLQETITSVQSQTFADWEHIVVDDGSDDGTAEAVAAVAADDPRVRYFFRGDGLPGASACRNQGLHKARSELIVFLDSDDILEPDCLARRVLIMERNQDLDFAVFRMGSFLRVPGDLGAKVNKDLHGDDLLGFLRFELPWQTTAPIWRRIALERVGGFDESLPSWQDVDLHVRALVAGMRYLKLPIDDYHMRWQEDPNKVSTLQRRMPEHLIAAERLLEKFECLVREGPGMNWTRQRALCGLYFFIAERWIEIRKTRAALACWHRIRERGLGDACLHFAGVVVLLVAGPHSPARTLGMRLAHKWKGWVRFRTNPALVPP